MNARLKPVDDNDDTDLAFCFLSPVSDILHPNYDDPSSSLKYYDIAKALTLGCNITKEGDYELSW